MVRAPRQHKTPRQRAEEALGVAQRKTGRSADKIIAAEEALADAKAEHAENERRLAYVEADPALQAEPDEVDEPHPQVP